MVLNSSRNRIHPGASLVAHRVKNTPAMQETWVWSLGQEDHLEKGTATHSRILAGESHGQRSLVGCSPWSRKELGMTERLTLSHFTLEKRLNTKEKDENKAVRTYLKYLHHIYLNV